MTGPRKTLLGILTAWPLAYALIFMAAAMVMVALTAGGRPLRAPGAEPPLWLTLLLVLHVGTMLLWLGLTVFYAVHALRSPRMPGSQRVLWVLLVVVGAFFAQLVYWYLFIRSEPGAPMAPPAPDR